MPASDLTGEGHILGTIAYMSPEQAQGKLVDQRSDIFSLGVVLFEMATGERPFTGDTNVSVISAMLKDTPPLVTEVNPELPAARAHRQARLVKDPEDRYQNAKDLRNDLKALKEESDSGELGRGPHCHAGLRCRPPHQPMPSAVTECPGGRCGPPRRPASDRLITRLVEMGAAASTRDLDEADHDRRRREEPPS